MKVQRGGLRAEMCQSCTPTHPRSSLDTHFKRNVLNIGQISLLCQLTFLHCLTSALLPTSSGWGPLAPTSSLTTCFPLPQVFAAKVLNLVLPNLSLGSIDPSAISRNKKEVRTLMPLKVTAWSVSYCSPLFSLKINIKTYKKYFLKRHFAKSRGLDPFCTEQNMWLTMGKQPSVPAYLLHP